MTLYGAFAALADGSVKFIQEIILIVYIIIVFNYKLPEYCFQDYSCQHKNYNFGSKGRLAKLAIRVAFSSTSYFIKSLVS